MFIRHWKDSPIIVTHGRLRDWRIFTRREGDKPDRDTGAVMMNLNHYSRAVLLDGVKTEPTTHADEAEFMFVIGGRGVVRVGDEEAEVRDGSSFQIPAGVAHALVNTGCEELDLRAPRRRARVR